MGESMPSPPSQPAHCQGKGRKGLPAPALPAEDADARGALPRPTRWSTSAGIRLPVGCVVLSLALAPPDPRIRYTFLVKRVVLLIYRVLVAGGLAEEPHGKLHFACADLSAQSLQCVYLSERHTQPSLAALPNAVWRLGSEGQMFGRRK